MTYYVLIGLAVTLISIYHYREDGTTDKKGELYWAAIGFLIWPFIIVKFILDKLK